MVHRGRLVKVIGVARGQLADQLSQLAKRLERQCAQATIGPRNRLVQRPVGPVAGDGIAASLGVAQDQDLTPTRAACLEDFEALAAQRMEGVRDRHPSQTGVRGECSWRGTSGLPSSELALRAFRFDS